MKKLIILLGVQLLIISIAYPQGCIAIRNIAGFGQLAQLGYGQTNNKWMMDINNRYFQASTFLQGKKNITPKDLSNGITFHDYTMNIGLTRILDNGWSIGIDMPVAANSQVGKGLNASGVLSTSHAFGVGDIRFTAYKWLLNTKASNKGNIQVGLGIKFPTGNYKAEDYAYTSTSDKSFKELVPVNPGIQLGDGGTGITTQINSFYIFNHTISVYGNFFYLISPNDQNAVPFWTPNLLPADVEKLYHATTNYEISIPDNYTMRTGANFSFNRFVATAGLRFEGSPAHDLVGQNDGHRSAGHIFSVEPGINYKFKNSFLYSFVTIPVDRRTIKTVPDKREEAITGVPTISPGHFANTLVFIGYAFTF
jgi:hypothetical protein